MLAATLDGPGSLRGALGHFWRFRARSGERSSPCTRRASARARRCVGPCSRSGGSGALAPCLCPAKPRLRGARSTPSQAPPVAHRRLIWELWGHPPPARLQLGQRREPASPPPLSPKPRRPLRCVDIRGRSDRRAAGARATPARAGTLFASAAPARPSSRARHPPPAVRRPLTPVRYAITARPAPPSAGALRGSILSLPWGDLGKVPAPHA